MFKKQKLTFLYTFQNKPHQIWYLKKKPLNISGQCYYFLQTGLLNIIHSKKL